MEKTTLLFYQQMFRRLSEMKQLMESRILRFNIDEWEFLSEVLPMLESFLTQFDTPTDGVSFENTIDSRNELQLFEDLGVFYALFGNTFIASVNYHVIKLVFKQTTTVKLGIFRYVVAEVYEDEKKICSNLTLEVEPFSRPSKSIRTIDLYYVIGGFEKYNNGCVDNIIYIVKYLQSVWNAFFENQAFPEPINYTTTLSLEDRRKIIDNVALSPKKQKFDVTIDYWYAVHAYRPFYSLVQVLEDSGVVYKIEDGQVKIWISYYDLFTPLIGYEYCSSFRDYSLFVEKYEVDLLY